MGLDTDPDYLAACKEHREHYAEMDSADHMHEATAALGRATALSDTDPTAPLVEQTLAIAQVHGLLAIGKLLNPEGETEQEPVLDRLP